MIQQTNLATNGKQMVVGLPTYPRVCLNTFGNEIITIQDKQINVMVADAVGPGSVWECLNRIRIPIVDVVKKLSYLHNGNSHDGETASIYWISPLAPCFASTSAAILDHLE